MATTVSSIRIQPSFISELQCLSNASQPRGQTLKLPNSNEESTSPARHLNAGVAVNSKFPPPFAWLVYPGSSYDDVAHGLHLKVGQIRLRGRR
jgi:hypothetical protein